MKKLLLSLMLLASSLLAQKIVVAGPVATISHPFFKMIEDKALGGKLEFRLWKNPDELRAMLINKEVNFVAVPTNVAANLYNKGVDLKLLSVPVWGILEVLSRDATLKKIEDLKGKEIVVPFRSDMPDIVLQSVLKKVGLDPKKDLRINYAATPPDAMQMMILRRADHVLLAEPATSMALRKTGSFPISIIAPELHRAFKLDDEWSRVVGGKTPTASLALFGEMEASLVEEFIASYNKALEWYKANPKEAGELTAKNIDFLTAEAVSDSIEHVSLEAVSAKDARVDLEDFYTHLIDVEPKLVGGKLPDSGFYYESK